MSMQVEYLKDSMELSGEIHVPVIIREQCPRCNLVVEKDLTKDPLISPKINQVFDLELSHLEGHECQYKWSIKVILRMGLAQAQPAIFQGWTEPHAKVQIIKRLRTLTGCSLIEGKKWTETKPHGISKELAEALEEVGAIIEWRYR